jgi:phosphatidate cytidylyltransferase
VLGQRVVTALVLLALLIPALLIGNPWPFALLTLLLISLAGWEWGRLNGASNAAPLLGIVLAAAGAVTLWSGWAIAAPDLAWWLAAIVWLLGGVWILSRGQPAWLALPQRLRWLLGLALLWVGWLALTNAKAFGVNFLLSALCLVWAADIAAYFGGRTFGRRKLAPSISPGKSWEGVWSGMAGALILAFVWLALDRSFTLDSQSLYGMLSARFGAVGLTLIVLFLAAMSVVGDLFESLVKRSAGAKDSSRLLPGHGGVLDRVDALLPVVPLALALLTI